MITAKEKRELAERVHREAIDAHYRWLNSATPEELKPFNLYLEQFESRIISTEGNSAQFSFARIHMSQNIAKQIKLHLQDKGFGCIFGTYPAMPLDGEGSYIFSVNW